MIIPDQRIESEHWRTQTWVGAIGEITSTIHIIYSFKGPASAGATPDDTVYEQYTLPKSHW